MKRTSLLVVVIVGLLASFAAARPWTSRSGGFSVEAELLDVRDGNAILKKADGSEVSVPLSKLSLGDVKYISEVLKAEEEGISGGRGSSAVPAAAKTPSQSPFGAAKPGSAPAAALKKLHYAWKKDQTYIYQVRIIGERGRSTEDRSGEVTYKVQSARSDEISLAMTSKLKRDDTSRPAKVVLLPGRRVGFVSDVDRVKEATIRIDTRGRLLESKGEAPLPYLLGDLSELVVEPLPAEEQATWTVQADPGVAVVSLSYPYSRFSMAGFREGVPAVEKTVYTVLGESDNLITIGKHYEMTSAAMLNGKPKIEASGEGKLKFDTQRSVFAGLDFDMRVTVRDANRTEETPLHVSYRLLSEQDIAEAAKEAQKAKEEAEKARIEKARPLTEKEIETAVADLASDDAARAVASAKLLAEKKPPQQNAKVAQALELAMLKSENVGVRAEAARALKNWATPESVPGLSKALNDSWTPVRAHAIEAMIRFAPKEAIKPVAQQMANMMTRGAAIKFLKETGPAAEDAVLSLMDSKDPWVKAEVCHLLESIGTKKSLPALEKAVADENWMVNGNARKAIPAIKAREEIGPNK